ncbi:hypothetical protein BDV98DRAFT_302911 [Pterulicium gracile]|uniref:Uncharacterized protein n=1 Tax=Pterulicium gracile TaxID=1884261 RepID=A0A5C3Q6B8_9AGAR|nr:hypothetical protein BDV98DRAFT_302911 [Pterula gracilis]
MHRCLEVEDILIHICAEIAGGERQKRGRYRQNLQSLACTSKNFSPAAIAQLWARLDGLKPLLHLLPTSVVSSSLQDTQLYVLEAPLTNKHWTALERYTRHIHHLTVTDNWALSTLHRRSDLEKLTTALHAFETPLLPNLHHLFIQSSSRPSLPDDVPTSPILIALAGTTLRSCTFLCRDQSSPLVVPTVYLPLISALSTS